MSIEKKASKYEPTKRPRYEILRDILKRTEFLLRLSAFIRVLICLITKDSHNKIRGFRKNCIWKLTPFEDLTCNNLYSLA